MLTHDRAVCRFFAVTLSYLQTEYNELNEEIQFIQTIIDGFSEHNGLSGISIILCALKCGDFSTSNPG